MLAVLPFIAFALLLPLCRQFSDSWRSAALAASVVWGSALTAITETFSLFHVLTRGAVLVFWVGVCAGLAVLNVALARSSKPGVPHEWNTTPIPLKLPLIGVGLIATTCLVIALISPPNTVDSMTYHMTRVEHWIQNKSLSHYPTHVLRELHRTPWAELSILHLRLLSDDDRFVNLVQWLSMLGSLFGVSLIARELGADLRGQAFAVVAAGTIPMLILQASSTQNDLAGSYWVVCHLYFLLVLLRQPSNERIWFGTTLLAGGSLGLAVLTKTTSYIHAFPFIVWFAVGHWRMPIRRVLGILLTLGLVAGALNAGYVGRNLQLFGTVFGPGGSEECEQCVLTNEAMSLPIFLSNVVRNTAMHARLPNKALNDAITHLVSQAHELIRADLVDPRSTWRQAPFSLVPPRFDENTDGNPLHLFLIIWTGMVLLYRRHEFSSIAKVYAGVLLAAFLLLSLVIKWGPPNIRYHLGLFILWAPISGLVLAKVGKRGIAQTVAIGLIVLAIPWLALNAYRPLLGERNIFNTPRDAQFFLYPPTMAFEESFFGASQFLRDNHCFRVGVERGPDDWEYPLWVLLRKQTSEPVRIDEVQVTNVSITASSASTDRVREPCATVRIRGHAIMASVKPMTP